MTKFFRQHMVEENTGENCFLRVDVSVFSVGSVLHPLLSTVIQT